MVERPRIGSLAKCPRGIVVGGLLLAVLVVGYFDIVAGRAISMRFLYVPLIVAAAWRCGMSIAFFVTAVASILHLASASPFTREWQAWWPSLVEAGVRLAVFSAIAVLVCRLAESQRRQRELARIDSLTGLSNRQAFLERAEEERSRCLHSGDSLTLAYLDVDDFKSVNDRWGHVVGDEVLADMGEALRSDLRHADAAARLGGDEFGLLLPESGSADAALIVERLRARLQSLAQARGWPITWSMGVVTFPQPPGSVREMIHAADEAMYAVKRSGKGAIRFETIEPGGDSSNGTLEA